MSEVGILICYDGFRVPVCADQDATFHDVGDNGTQLRAPGVFSRLVGDALIDALRVATIFLWEQKRSNSAVSNGSC